MYQNLFLNFAAEWFIVRIHPILLHSPANKYLGIYIINNDAVNVFYEDMQCFRLFYVYACVHEYVCMHHMHVGTFRSQKTASDPIELELQVVYNHLI